MEGVKRRGGETERVEDVKRREGEKRRWEKMDAPFHVAFLSASDLILFIFFYCGYGITL